MPNARLCVIVAEKLTRIIPLGEDSFPTVDIIQKVFGTKCEFEITSGFTEKKDPIERLEKMWDSFSVNEKLIVSIMVNNYISGVGLRPLFFEIKFK